MDINNRQFKCVGYLKIKKINKIGKNKIRNMNMKIIKIYVSTYI